MRDVNTINNDETMNGAARALLAGRYRVVRQLGQGGMGSVWLAEDTKLDGFKVAIKMLPSVLVNNKRAYAQVKAEALVSLKLSHPNIATVRAFEEECGSPFLVMDYIDGQTLDDYLAEKGNLSEEETVRLLKPVAAALDYAHSQGVVHRDVKPGNVMIDKSGHPYVLDFGIAREVQETMTRVTGKLSSGTLLYMSPEQLNGDAPRPAQDIYSFAAMAYECLKGEPPFSRGGIEDQIKHKTPEALNEDIAIGSQVMAGLAKEPESRPRDCKGVLTLVKVPRMRLNPLIGTGKRTCKWIALLLLVAVAGGALAIANLVRTSVGRDEGVTTSFWVEVLDRAARQGLKRQKPVASPVDSPLSSQGKAEADSARVEAVVKIEACRRIDKGDGFGPKIEACEDSLARALAEYELQKWPEAAKSYNAAVGQCAAVLGLSKERDRAREAAVAMEKRARDAKDAEADRYAAVLFKEAKDTVVRARSEFAAMRFAEAAAAHSEAANLFEKATGEALSRKLEMAREEETSRRSESGRNEFAKDKEEIKGRNPGDEMVIALPGGATMAFCWCPATTSAAWKKLSGGKEYFLMGSPETEEGRSSVERRCRTTLTQGFWMGKHEVTQAQWESVMGENPSSFKGADRPVEWVSWDDCQAFIRKVNSGGQVTVALPTEAQWEYACRAGTATPFSFGQSLNGDKANCDCNYPYGTTVRGSHRKETASVGSYLPNAWGLYDMHGNVLEWCMDRYGKYDDDALDPVGSDSGIYRVARGGCWDSPALLCRSSNRSKYVPALRDFYLGFRLVCSSRDKR